MKQTIYGSTEIVTYPACFENCAHCQENEDGKRYCELYPEDGEITEDNAPSLVFSTYHGTYGNVSSSGCDCEEYETPYDGE